MKEFHDDLEMEEARSGAIFRPASLHLCLTAKST